MSNRKYNKCPICRNSGDPVWTTPLIDSNGSKLVYRTGVAPRYKCLPCSFEWDANEDFNCEICGKEVPGRFLTCGDDDCNKKWKNI